VIGVAATLENEAICFPLGAMESSYKSLKRLKKNLELYGFLESLKGFKFQT